MCILKFEKHWFKGYVLLKKEQEKAIKEKMGAASKPGTCFISSSLGGPACLSQGRKQSKFCRAVLWERELSQSSLSPWEKIRNTTASRHPQLPERQELGVELRNLCAMSLLGLEAAGEPWHMPHRGPLSPLRVTYILLRVHTWAGHQ